ncbi:helix-turn-helix domain-containing protein [Micromonospora sp. NPDC048894]|uniref:helix-turn-helix domain-containing protein n=1 Tax=unclassified Micromonospora TaxID=2617518 RepID=UPI0033C44634
MARPERPLPADGGPIVGFAQDLRLLREKAGSPKYLLMARRTGRSRTALAEAAGGDHLPSWDTVRAFVEACGGDPMEWLPRWEHVRAVAREDRVNPTSATTGAPPPGVPSVSADDVAILLRLWQEQRDQARQSENHRAIVSPSGRCTGTASTAAAVPWSHCRPFTQHRERTDPRRTAGRRGRRLGARTRRSSAGSSSRRQDCCHRRVRAGGGP